MNSIASIGGQGIFNKVLILFYFIFFILFFFFVFWDF